MNINKKQAELNKAAYESYKGEVDWLTYMAVLDSIGLEAAKAVLRGAIFIFPFIGYLFICKKKPDERYKKIDFTKSEVEWCEKTGKRTFTKMVHYPVPDFIYKFFFKKYTYTGVERNYAFKANQKFLKRGLIDLVQANESLSFFIEAESGNQITTEEVKNIARFTTGNVLEKVYGTKYELEIEYSLSNVNEAIKTKKPYKNKLWRLIKIL